MLKRSAELKTGIVVIAASIALLLLLYYAKGGDLFAPKHYVALRVEQGRLAPREKDPILMNGLAIGKAEEVRFQTEVRRGTALTLRDRARLRDLIERGASGMSSERADAVLGLLDDPEGRLPDDVEIREIYVYVVAKITGEHAIPKGSHGIIAESITGLRALHIEPGASGENLDLPASRDAGLPVIPVVQAPDVTDLMRNLDEELDALGAELSLTMGNLRGNLDKAGRTLDKAHDTVAKFEERVLDSGRIDRTLENVEAASASLRAALGGVEGRLGPILDTVDETVADFRKVAAAGAELAAGIRPKVDAILADLESVSARIDKIVERADPEIEGLLADARKVGANLVGLSEDLAAAGPRVRTTLESAAKDVDVLLESLLETGQNLADASEDIRAHPWKLLNEPSADEIAFENLRNTMLNYVRAMTRVDRVTATVGELLGRAEGDPEARAKLARALEQLDASLERYRYFETRLMELLQQNQVPAAAVRREPPPTVRPR